VLYCQLLRLTYDTTQTPTRSPCRHIPDESRRGEMLSTIISGWPAVALYKRLYAGDDDSAPADAGAL
jgi:hypothetical protein